ncbi:hypothetical protein CASFOL_005274 [Castilleja foliolosa]|uniref:Uncharacterized protein n=1 Tax=Castilleja foliolosa TaxID=1961234 RepID=A0ABD3E423_9LAMI
MGCGESKQAVSTENTLIKSKSKAKKSENINNLPVEKPTTNDDDDDDPNVNNANAGENVKENEKIPLMEKENDHSIKKDDEKEKQVLDHGDNQESGPKKPADKPVSVVEENIKGDSKNDELKGGENENVTHENETIESIVSDGKSDYYSSYPKGHVSEGNTEENDADDKLYKKEEVLKVEEVKVLSRPTDEPKPSENETANAASTTEVKAN